MALPLETACDSESCHKGRNNNEILKIKAQILNYCLVAINNVLSLHVENKTTE